MAAHQTPQQTAQLASARIRERWTEILEHAGNPAQHGYAAERVTAEVDAIRVAVSAGDWRRVVALKGKLYEGFVNAAMSRGPNPENSIATDLGHLRKVLERDQAPADHIKALVASLAAARVIQLLVLIASIAQHGTPRWRPAAREVLKAQLITGVSSPDVSDGTPCLACGKIVAADDSTCSGCGATLQEQRR